MKAISITLASTLVLTLVSCSGHRGTSVPDMPYRKTDATQTPATPTTTGEPQTISDDQLLPPMNGITPTVTPTVTTPTTPAVSPTPSFGSALIPTSPVPTSPTTSTTSPVVSSSGYAPIPQQIPSPTPASTATPAPTSSTPVAARVEGDPHRVYNPWNPAQRIRITDPKTGLPFPSGKVLGIPNSDKKFIVP